MKQKKCYQLKKIVSGGKERKILFEFAILIAMIIALIIIAFIVLPKVLPGPGSLLITKENTKTLYSNSSLIIDSFNMSSEVSTISIENNAAVPIVPVSITLEFTDGTKVTGDLVPSGQKQVRGEVRTYSTSSIVCRPGSIYNSANILVSYNILQGIKKTPVQSKINNVPVTVRC